MSGIQSVFERLNDVEASITTLERDATADDALAQRLALLSLQMRRDELRQMADELSAQQMIDVCDYRIIPDTAGGYPVKAVSGAMSTFQDMLTAFFVATREGRPRQKAAFEADVVRASTLNVGYAYSGSLGVVLYVPSDQLLITDSDLDIAFNGIIELTQQEGPTGVRKIAERFGRAAVRSFYSWSGVHIAYALSADIKWKRGAEVKAERLIQPAELTSVSAYIDQAEDRSEETVTVEGVLVALDVKRKSFKLSFPESPDIHGPFDDGFDWSRPHNVPGRYRATVLKKVSAPLWSEQETTTWTLMDLVELK